MGTVQHRLRATLVAAALVVAAAWAACAQNRGVVAKAPAAPAKPVEYAYEIVKVFPHDREAYTQGLQYHQGFLFEGTGLNGRSSLRKVQLETGKVLQSIPLSSEFFGEGIAIVGDEIAQLTWQNGIGFVYGLRDFRLRRKFSYTGEGWGMATNGREVFMSDGSAAIRVLDPRTFAEKSRFTVLDGDHPVTRLNELEWVEGEIYANVYQTERIARISPRTGHVTGWIDMNGLLSPVMRSGQVDVLNGIAYDPAGKRLFATGKLWPSLFQIRVVRKPRR